jgi:hypothetical protein
MIVDWPVVTFHVAALNGAVAAEMVVCFRLTWAAVGEWVAAKIVGWVSVTFTASQMRLAWAVPRVGEEVVAFLWAALDFWVTGAFEHFDAVKAH